jgi:cytochrome c
MRFRLVAPALAALSLAQAALAADAGHGKELYTACLACHGDSQHKATIGPSLVGVIGRQAGTFDDFRYSPAMKRSAITWDDQSLRAYIMDPQKAVKGNRMPYGGVGNAADADDVIAYLHTLK